MKRLVEWNCKEKNSALPVAINDFGDTYSTEEICAQLAVLYDIIGDCDLDRLRELVEADREDRIEILPVALAYTCGSCANFRRTPGKRSGICSARSLNRNRRGTELPNAGAFTPSQSRRACKQYAPCKELAEVEPKGSAHGNE